MMSAVGRGWGWGETRGPATAAAGGGAHFERRAFQGYGVGEAGAVAECSVETQVAASNVLTVTMEPGYAMSKSMSPPPSGTTLVAVWRVLVLFAVAVMVMN